MAARLFNILNLVYMPLFIDERAAQNNVQKENIRQTIASVPLVCYVASFMTAIFLKLRGDRCNDKVRFGILKMMPSIITRVIESNF